MSLPAAVELVAVANTKQKTVRRSTSVNATCSGGAEKHSRRSPPLPPADTLPVPQTFRPSCQCMAQPANVSATKSKLRPARRAPDPPVRLKKPAGAGASSSSSPAATRAADRRATVAQTSLKTRLSAPNLSLKSSKRASMPTPLKIKCLPIPATVPIPFQLKTKSLPANVPPAIAALPNKCVPTPATKRMQSPPALSVPNATVPHVAPCGPANKSLPSDKQTTGSLTAGPAKVLIAIPPAEPTPQALTVPTLVATVSHAAHAADKLTSVSDKLATSTEKVPPPIPLKKKNRKPSSTPASLDPVTLPPLSISSKKPSRPAPNVPLPYGIRKRTNTRKLTTSKSADTIGNESKPLYQPLLPLKKAGEGDNTQGVYSTASWQHEASKPAQIHEYEELDDWIDQSELDLGDRSKDQPLSPPYNYVNIYPLTAGDQRHVYEQFNWLAQGVRR